MIKIEKILPLGADKAIPVSSIEDEYFRRIKLYRNPLSIISECVRLNTSSIGIVNRLFSPDELSFLSSFNSPDAFKNLILAKPNELEDLRNNTPLNLFRNPGEKSLNEFGEFVLAIFGYEKYFRDRKRKGIWLASQLNIKSCPYCNAQYTLTISSKSRGTKALFQFDHFIGKKESPHLSISLYNLIPSCGVCNQLKSDKSSPLNEYYHPYHFDLASVTKFQLVQKRRYKLPQEVDEKHLAIRFTKSQDGFDQIISNHEQRFDIDAIYDRHRDVVKDIMVQSVIHNSAFKRDLLKIKSLFNGDDSLYNRYVLGNFSKKDEILNRPLTKMTQDIAKELKLI